MVAAAVVTGAVVAAPTPARPPPPGSLMAPRQASGAAVALAEAEGHLHMSPQYQQLHPHPYPQAQHRSRASAHPDPDPLLLSFCFYGRQEYQSTQTRSGPFSTTSLRPEAIQAPNFELHAECRHDRFLHSDWASWPNPGDNRWLFGCPLRARHPSFLPFSIKKLSSLEQCS